MGDTNPEYRIEPPLLPSYLSIIHPSTCVSTKFFTLFLTEAKFYSLVIVRSQPHGQQTLFLRLSFAFNSFQVFSILKFKMSIFLFTCIKTIVRVRCLQTHGTCRRNERMKRTVLQFQCHLHQISSALDLSYAHGGQYVASFYISHWSCHSSLSEFIKKKKKN